ncbi:hypothetical protein BGV52_29630 [Burkholderia ubonensis]|uniref:hypothetical protein n=1 Tax=Burkholderia ubonensis TaxID=101571 RepID=UPI0007584B43|nr:hypothetical protein [Burkholderia ubonensis]KVW61709.1 hypothetical protein WK98_29330 [Burkholderia ubonensis]OJB03532.1 hypothetical protein BGV52_29630 [Burkholderia ubonensis]OJB57015.1 hypothetical protein BGV61_19520 [Burkholderia ubonensis]
MELRGSTLLNVGLRLMRASDDPALQDPAFQAELRTFSGSLRAADVRFSQRAMTFDAVDATGYALAEYVVKELGPAAIGVIGTAVGAWINGRAGRKVRLKVGDVEVEARTPEEVEQLLKQVQALQTDQRGKQE